MQLKMLIVAIVIMNFQTMLCAMEKEMQVKEPQIHIDYEIKESTDGDVKKGSLVYSLTELENFKNIYYDNVQNILIIIKLSCELRDKPITGKQYIKYELKKKEYVTEGAHTHLTYSVKQKTMIPETDTGYFTHFRDGKMSKLEFKLIKN